MRLQSLETFYWLARLGKFHLVAERLNTSQPAISARIKALEEEIGVELFDRSARTAKLNGNGRRLLPYAERLMASVNEIRVGFVEKKWILQTVRFGVSDAIASTWFLEFMKNVSETYDNIRIEMVCDTSMKLAAMLEAYEIDIGILLGPLKLPTAKQRIISRYPLIWVKSPEHSAPESLSPELLRAQTIVTYPRDTLVYQQIANYLSDENFVPPRIHSASSSGVMLSMVLKGWCIATLPVPVAQPYLESGQLVEIRCGFDFDPLVYVATYLNSPWSILHDELTDVAGKIAARSGAIDR